MLDQDFSPANTPLIQRPDWEVEYLMKHGDSLEVKNAAEREWTDRQRAAATAWKEHIQTWNTPRTTMHDMDLKHLVPEFVTEDAMRRMLGSEKMAMHRNNVTVLEAASERAVKAGNLDLAQQLYNARNEEEEWEEAFHDKFRKT